MTTNREASILWQSLAKVAAMSGTPLDQIPAAVERLRAAHDAATGSSSLSAAAGASTAPRGGFPSAPPPVGFESPGGGLSRPTWRVTYSAAAKNGRGWRLGLAPADSPSQTEPTYGNVYDQDAAVAASLAYGQRVQATQDAKSGLNGSSFIVWRDLRPC